MLRLQLHRAMLRTSPEVCVILLLLSVAEQMPKDYIAPGCGNLVMTLHAASRGAWLLPCQLGLGHKQVLPMSLYKAIEALGLVVRPGLLGPQVILLQLGPGGLGREVACAPGALQVVPAAPLGGARVAEDTGHLARQPTIPGCICSMVVVLPRHRPVAALLAVRRAARLDAPALPILPMLRMAGATPLVVTFCSRMYITFGSLAVNGLNGLCWCQCFAHRHLRYPQCHRKPQRTLQ